MPKTYNDKFVLVQTYTPEDLLSEDGKRMDESPLMSIAIGIDWLRKEFAKEEIPMTLEEFLDDEATFDSFEYPAITAIQEDQFAFAVYDNGEEQLTLFPERCPAGDYDVRCMMDAYRQYQLEETVFDHICRVIRHRPMAKDTPAVFMEDGPGCLVFGSHWSLQYEGEMGAEKAFIDILRQCGEIVSMGENGILRLEDTV